jgi:glutathione S-transferase
MSRILLVIGNKNYSSWSLRAWLVLRKCGVEFDERRLSLDTPEFQEDIADLSPTRRVPVLWHDAQCIWDSLAIAEYANEQFANGGMWPVDSRQRGLARAVSAEMHAGFSTLRRCLPMNCRAHQREVEIKGELEAEIGRVLSIWSQCRQARKESGDWLFGRFSIADAMFVPVAIRFHGYAVNLPGFARDYVDAVLRDADVAEWVRQGALESEVIEAEEVGVNAARATN